MHNRMDFSAMTLKQLCDCGSIPTVEIMMVIAAHVCDQIVTRSFVDASVPKKRERMSPSITTTRAPSSANRFAVSEPTNPADPVTMTLRIYSTVNR